MPKSRTRRPTSKSRPRRRSGPLRTTPSGRAEPTPERPTRFTIDGVSGAEWEYCRDLIDALDHPGFGEWVDALPLVSMIDDALRRSDDGRVDRGALAPAGDDADDRAWVVEAICRRFSLLVEDGDELRAGQGVLTWMSVDARTRTWFRAFVVVAAAEEVVRGLPGSSYHGEQVSSRLAEAVAAAAGPGPAVVSDLEGRGGAIERHFLEPEVRRGLERLRWLGLLADGPVLVAPPQGEALLQTLARALEEMPVPEPRLPDSRVTGLTYEVEASVVVDGRRRTRLVRISGSSKAGVLTDLLLTAFGLRAEGRTSRLTGAPLSPLLGEPGLLTAAGADRCDPWTLAVGHVESLEDPGQGNAVVSATGVTVTSVVEHLGDCWEVPLRMWGDADLEDPVLHLRVVRTVSAEDSRDLVFPSCLAGDGEDLSPAAAPFDLDDVEAQVARVHRDRR